MNNKCIISSFYAIISLIALVSCNSKDIRLVIQNNSIRDSLKTIVKINGQEMFNAYVKKATSSISYSETKFHRFGKIVDVQVEIPKIGAIQKELTEKEDLEQIIITIRSKPLSAIPLEEGKLNTIPRKEEVLIAFFGKKENDAVP